MTETAFRTQVIQQAEHSHEARHRNSNGSLQALLVRRCARVPAAQIAGPAAADEDYFYVVNTSTKMMAEVMGHSKDLGAWVGLWPHYGGTSQQFAVVWTKSPGAFPTSEKDPWFLLKARHSGWCLRTTVINRARRSSRRNAAESSGQMWRVQKIAMTPADCPSGRCFGGERHILQNYYDRGKRCLDAANGKFPTPPVQGAGLQAWDCIGK